VVTIMLQGGPQNRPGSFGEEKILASARNRILSRSARTLVSIPAALLRLQTIKLDLEESGCEWIRVSQGRDYFKADEGFWACPNCLQISKKFFSVPMGILKSKVKYCNIP
jgi:hypothetical protein